MIKIVSMKDTITRISIVIALLISLVGRTQNTITPDDLGLILGEWTGELTYMDYSSNKPFTMPANLSVKHGKNQNQLILFNIYPNEPKANNRDKIKISNNGTQINAIEIKSRKPLENGDIEIITEYPGEDNKRQALIRNIYILGSKRFIIRREVRFEDSESWLVRNEFNYTR